MKHEDSIDTDINAIDDLGNARDEDKQANRSNRHYTGEVSFFHRSKGPEHPDLDYLVPSEERYDRLMSYRFYRLKTQTQLESQVRQLDFTAHPRI